jgi:sugar/nucleoside kinase (ribokinase family)
MAKTHNAVVAGHLCLDIIPDMRHNAQDNFATMFLPGRLLEVGSATFSTGGPVSNTGLALHKLGISTQLMGKVGDDLFGQAVKQLMSAYDPHLADSMLVDETVSTSYTVVINPPGVDRIFLHCPGANDTFNGEDVPYDLLSTASLFHFGYPPIMRLMYADGGGQLSEIFRRAKETGVTCSLDMALPDPASAAGRADWPTILKKTLPYVDIFLPSIEEILFMARRETYDELCRQAGGPNFLPLLTPELLSDLSRELQELGAKIVCFKLGDRGFYLRTPARSIIESLGRACPSNPAAWANQELWASCFEVELVGAAGSGDTTIAGFLAALLRDMSPQEAVTAAVAVGACNVEAADTLSGLRSWEETMARIAAGWPRHELALETPGWQFDDVYQHWNRS